MSPREAELEETVLQLRRLLLVEPARVKVDKLQAGLRITRQQACLMATLHEAGSTYLPVERLEMALPEGRSDEPRTLQVVYVQIAKIREQLGRDTILCLCHAGYTLGAPGVLACKRVLAEAEAAA